jgi:hypothetical protein
MQKIKTRRIIFFLNLEMVLVIEISIKSTIPVIMFEDSNNRKFCSKSIRFPKMPLKINDPAIRIDPLVPIAVLGRSLLF